MDISTSAIDSYQSENDAWKRFLVTGKESDRIEDVAQDSEKWDVRLGITSCRKPWIQGKSQDHCSMAVANSD